MPSEITARLRRFLGKSGEGHGVHAPFRVTTHRGHTVQAFESLELALEAAEALGSDHYVACPRKRSLTFLPKLPRDRRRSRLITLAVRDWPRHMFQ